jgi:hypothetical protein
LEGLLPKMEHLVEPSLFDPVREKSHFRMSGPDNVCTVVLPRLCRQYVDGRSSVCSNSTSEGTAIGLGNSVQLQYK